MIDFTGETLLVAGSSRGIGAATAELLATLGGRVILHGRTMTDRLRQSAADLGGFAVACDGRDPDAVQVVVDQLTADGNSVDALVCTLGSVEPRPILEPGQDVWIEQYRSNVLATVNFIQAVAPSMLARRRGRIATVSSIRGRGHMASPDVAAYGASKAALENVTVAFAKELAPHVTVNCVAPGFVLTDMSATWSADVHRELATNLLGRAASPEEIAKALAFLVSDANSFMTGQVIALDGGLEARTGS